LAVSVKYDDHKYTVTVECMKQTNKITNEA